MGKVNTKIDVSKDGVDHINMYSKANTEFGRMLSDFYHYPIHTKDGDFQSVEGYWYYLSLPETVDRDRMRKLYGYMAKKTGRELREKAGEENLLFDENFNEKILSAIEQKIKGNIHLYKDEYEGLPIIHYYLFKNGCPYDVTEDFPWLVEGINKLVEEICYNKDKDIEKE